MTTRKAPLTTLSHDPRPQAQRRYRIVALCDRAIRAMRELEDWARLDLHDDVLADRAREIHEVVTERILNGRRDG